MDKLSHLSLFTGAGGGELAAQHLLNWETLGYVEIDEYCQEVLKARIRDGLLHAAPIFGDIRKFISEGYAEAYQGMVDVVSGGFPCQAFSFAGKMLAEKDSRNMWPATIEAIRHISPPFVFLENSPGLFSRRHRYFEKVLGDLALCGYNARWKIISASELGAPHVRKRIWVLAYANEQHGNAGRSRAGAIRGEQSEQAAIRNCKQAVADPKSLGWGFWGAQDVGPPGQQNNTPDHGGEVLANPDGPGLKPRSQQDCRESCRVESPHRRDVGGQGGSGGAGAKDQPGLGRAADVPAAGMDLSPAAEPWGFSRVAKCSGKSCPRTRAVGNSQYPPAFAKAWQILTEGIVE